jgi:hypothetical protein
MLQYPRYIPELADLDTAIEKFVLPGFLPPQPIIQRTSRIRTQGSCFAENIAQALQEAGCTTRHLSFPEAVNSPLANAALFEHVLDPGRAYDLPEHEALFSRQSCALAAEKIPAEDVFILTLGVAPCVYPVNSPMPSFVADAKRIAAYEMRHTSVDENVCAITAIISALRKLNPDIVVVLTVSPVPLNRALNLGSPVSVDAISKSTLVVAASRYMAMAPPGVYYWPSFEIVRWLVPHVCPPFGAEDAHLRHVNRDLVGRIVRLFLKHYMTNGES